MNSEHPFTLVHQPADLPTHEQISLGAPHLDSVYAVGFAIDADWVETAYQRGLFPWYNEGEPVLWHSPEPRMGRPCRAQRQPESQRSAPNTTRQAQDAPTGKTRTFAA